MTAVVFPEAPAGSTSPVPSAPAPGGISSLINGIAYYGILVGGLLFPIIGGIYALLTH